MPSFTFAPSRPSSSEVTILTWPSFIEEHVNAKDHVNAKNGRSDDVDDEDDVDHLDLQCVSWLSFIEYYSVWSMLLFTVLGALDLSLKRWSNSADASAAQCTC